MTKSITNRSKKNRAHYLNELIDQMRGWYIHATIGPVIEEDMYLEIEVCSAKMPDGSIRHWIEPPVPAYDNVCVIEREKGDDVWECGLFPWRP